MESGDKFREEKLHLAEGESLSHAVSWPFPESQEGHGDDVVLGFESLREKLVWFRPIPGTRETKKLV